MRTETRTPQGEREKEKEGKIKKDEMSQYSGTRMLHSMAAAPLCGRWFLAQKLKIVNAKIRVK